MHRRILGAAGQRRLVVLVYSGFNESFVNFRMLGSMPPKTTAESACGASGGGVA
jgi:hypothetical protein